MPTHLKKRDGTYHFRRVKPRDVHAILGEGDWSYSLRTKDYAEAKRRVAVETVRTNEMIERVRAEPAAGAVGGDAEDAAPEPQGGAHSATPALTDLEAERTAFDAEKAAQKAERQRLRAPFRAVWRERMHLTTLELPPEFAALKDLMAERDADLIAARQQADLLKADNEMVRASRSDPNSPHRRPVAVKPLSIIGLPDAYTGEVKTLKIGTLRNWRTHVRHLSAFLGHDDAQHVTTEDLIEWKDALLNKAGRGGKPVKPKTVQDGYLATIRALFQWAADNRKIAANPALGVKTRVRPEAKVRERGFTDQEAHAVLAATFSEPPKRMTPEYKLARRWVPWLCAYTGARVGEIAQLRAEDVQEIEGIWTIRITPEAGTVKTNVFRIVPLHSQLLDMGFVAVAKAHKAGPMFYSLERQRVADGDNRLVQKVGEKISALMREAGLSGEAVSQPSHAWRHRFKTEARRHELELQAADIIQGHAPPTEGGKYGGWPLSRLSKELEKLPSYEITRA